MLSMKKVILILFFIFSFLNIQSANAKTQKWKFEAQSANADLIKCIKIVDVKSKRSALKTLSNMGLGSETGFIVRLQNNCTDEIVGTYKFKVLDKEGFIVEEKYFVDFRVGRKGISKQTFEIIIGTIAWSKIKKVRNALLEFDFEVAFDVEMKKEIEALKKIIYGQN